MMSDLRSDKRVMAEYCIIDISLWYCVGLAGNSLQHEKHQLMITIDHLPNRLY